MNVLFCGYRSWVSYVEYYFAHFNTTFKAQKHCILGRATSPDQLQESVAKWGDELDCIVLLGWSWIVPKEICERYMVVGVHPSDLPEYAGGSPLQHQILDGLKKTKCTLFRITSQLDGGGIYAKTEMSLEGNIDRITNSHLSNASIDLLETFFADDDPQFEAQGEVKTRKRLKPEDSNMEKVLGESVEDIYNFIRCRASSDYPKAYIEDEKGRLEFIGVRYIPHSEDQ